MLVGTVAHASPVSLGNSATYMLCVIICATNIKSK